MVFDFQLEFEAAQFPAVTVCNLSPYKYSVIKNVDEIREKVKALFTCFSSLDKSFSANFQTTRRSGF